MEDLEDLYSEKSNDTDEQPEDASVWHWPSLFGSRASSSPLPSSSSSPPPPLPTITTLPLPSTTGNVLTINQGGSILTSAPMHMSPSWQSLNDLTVICKVGEGITIASPIGLVGSGINVDLSGIHKMIPCINGTFTCATSVTHILGLLLIEGITAFNIDNGGQIDKIMNKYVGTKDILSAQDELLDLGLKDHARL